MSSDKNLLIEDLSYDPNSMVQNCVISNQLGGLVQGNFYSVKSANTIKLLLKLTIYTHTLIMQTSFIFDDKRLQLTPNCCHIVVYWDKLLFNGDAFSPTVLLWKLFLVHSTNSNAKKADRFLSTDLKDFVSANPMAKSEYMHITLKQFLKDIVNSYNLNTI